MNNTTVKRSHFVRTQSEDVTFVSKEQAFDKSNIECYNCHKLGNFANECAEKSKKNGTAVVTFEETQMINEEDILIGTSFVQTEVLDSKRYEPKESVKIPREEIQEKHISEDSSIMSGWGSYEFSDSESSKQSEDWDRNQNEHNPLN